MLHNEHLRLLEVFPVERLYVFSDRVAVLATSFFLTQFEARIDTCSRFWWTHVQATDVVPARSTTTAGLATMVVAVARVTTQLRASRVL